MTDERRNGKWRKCPHCKSAYLRKVTLKSCIGSVRAWVCPHCGARMFADDVTHGAPVQDGAS